MTTSIIVYRNPLEQQLWEGTSNGQMFPIMCGVMVFILAFITFDTLLGMFVQRTASNRQVRQMSSLTLAAISSAVLVYNMWI